MTSTAYFTGLRERIAEYGGLFNAHLHLDRSGTYATTLRMLQESGQVASGSSLSLATKHSLIPLIHASECYRPKVLADRVRKYLDLLVADGTTRADTLVDCTADQVGLSAIETVLGLKQEYRESIDLRVAAYTPLGFKDSEPERWECFEQAALIADFLAGLPERDDRDDYPDHIGYDESCRRLLWLSHQTNKPLHLHVDQKNVATERGAERVLDMMTKLNLPRISTLDEPRVWLVHMISSAAFGELRFTNLLTKLVDHCVGVICCPSAAISMRQVRTLLVPTHNSIARVLEMLAAGIQVRIGSDNIDDITSPAGTTDLIDELFVLCNALRFYDDAILAKLGAGVRLSDAERERIQIHLKNDQAEIRRVADGLGHLQKAA